MLFNWQKLSLLKFKSLNRKAILSFKYFISIFSALAKVSSKSLTFTSIGVLIFFYNPVRNAKIIAFLWLLFPGK